MMRHSSDNLRLCTIDIFHGMLFSLFSSCRSVYLFVQEKKMREVNLGTIQKNYTN